MKRPLLPHPATLLPWLVASFSLLWLKMSLLHAFPLTILRPDSSARSHLYTSLVSYRMDVLVLAGLIPLGLTLLFILLPRKLRLPLLATACLVIEVLVYAEGRSFEMIGQYSSLEMFRAAISWGTNGTGAQDYLPVTGLIKLIIAFVAILGITFYAHRVTRNDEGSAPRLRRNFPIGYLALAALLWVSRWAAPAPANAMTASILDTVGRSFLGIDAEDDQTKSMLKLSVSQLVSQYRQMANAPISEKDSRFFGKAKGQNVIVLIWETGPQRYFALDGDLSDFPNLARLRAHSIVAKQDHTTYPYTNRAHCSIFTSLYPYARSGFQSFPNRRLPGVISSLKDDGYETDVYGHLWTGENDANMYQSIGFNKYVIPPGGLDSGNAPWREKIAIDHGALEMMERDIVAWNKSGKKFAVSFLPNVGHGPWPDMSDDNNAETIPERGRALMHLEDKWVGELLDVLDKNNMMSDTLIVVTADHGIRNKVDDPDFRSGMIDDYSFHVPLMIYSSAIPERVDIPWITSHVDIAPSVLDLLGVENGRQWEEGAPIWQEDLKNRTTYFMASLYLGADGEAKDQDFYMVRYMSNAAYESSTLHFGARPLTGPKADEVQRETGELNALEQTIFYKFAAGTAN